ncbi:MAG: hypothetical protein CMK99_00460 [Pseudomonas sp.]|nr:hypothetical protein [Pseudomonas sp.]
MREAKQIHSFLICVLSTIKKRIILIDSLMKEISEPSQIVQGIMHKTKTIFYLDVQFFLRAFFHIIYQ